MKKKICWGSLKINMWRGVEANMRGRGSRKIYVGHKLDEP